MVNCYVVIFIGELNIIDGVYKLNKIVIFLGVDFECGFYLFKDNEKVDVVIRFEDFDVVSLDYVKFIGIVVFFIFKGVYNELDVMVGDYKLMVNIYEIY